MALSDLTEAQAVLQALNEFDRIGRDRFLQKYGFHRSQRYFIEHKGKRYDSKAVVGAAYAYQHPDRGQLTAANFSGGERTVQAKLEKLGFKVIVESQPSRNPKWAVDELILALDLYFRYGLLDDADSRVIALSNLLNRLPIHAHRPDAIRFRNPNGVALKLANFASLDPAYHGRGMQGGGALDRDVWNRYCSDRGQLAQLAAELRGAVEGISETFPDNSEEGEGVALEGRLRYRQHFARERDRKIVERKKQQAATSGRGLACDVCGFDFAEQYGVLGMGFIECHHTVPLSAAGERTTRLEDLALVCSNCHRMLHRQQPWLTLEDLASAILTSQRQHRLATVSRRDLSIG